MIVFKSLKWKNFLSTGNNFTELKLDTHQATLVVGDNGAGKSTFLDALSFVLYGKPFRKINKPQLINSINKKDLRVEVCFHINNSIYVIKRGMKPNLFEIWQNGALINQDADSRDYQEYLEKHILKLNHKSFSQIVVLGSSTFVPFMQLPATTRREVIEDLLDLQIFSIMNNLLKERIAENEHELRDCDYNLKLLEEKITLIKQHIEVLEANNKKKIDDNIIKITNNSAEIKNLQANADNLSLQIKELSKAVAELNKLKTKFEKYKTLSVQINSKLTDYKTEINFFESHNNCPTCKQDINDEFKCTTIASREEKIKEAKDGLEKLIDEKSKIEIKIEEINTAQLEIQKLQSLVSEKQWQINTLNSSNQQLSNENKALQEATNKDTKESQQLETFEKDKETSTLKKINLVNEKNNLGIISFILKDTGIKTRIIRQYIPIMNKLINKYLAAMDFFVQFELDENFNESIKSRFRDEFSYESFSEGEKMRIDLALLFTWRAVAKIRNSASTNLLIMDEVFDSSLDSSGTDEFMKILNDLTSDTNVYIISHKGDQLFDKFNNIIKFEKHKSFSRIAE